MDQQDKKISKLYKETYENVHASEDFKEKMMTMTNKKSKKSKIVKVVCILAAAAVMVTAGTIAVSASRTQYDKIIINGEEKMARYVDYGTGTRMWECEENDTAYSVFGFVK